jgi:hypothetical protein
VLAALQQIAAAETPLREQLLVAVVGPLVTVLLGTGLVSWILWRLDQRADEQRAAEQIRREEDRRAQETRERVLEQDRAREELESQLRRALLTPLLVSASELYLSTQHYWRVTGDPSRASEEPEARKAMDEQYRRSRATISVSEMEFDALFDTDEPARLCHRIDDLLTVRYMQLIGKATDNLYKQNSLNYEGKEHSGLSRYQPRNAKTVLDSYRSALKELTRSVLRAPFR